MTLTSTHVAVDKSNHMLGSYGPKADSQVAKTPAEVAPSGMLARGHYTVKSQFIDDDKTVHLEWEWFGIMHGFASPLMYSACRSFDIKKEW